MLNTINTIGFDKIVINRKLCFKLEKCKRSLEKYTASENVCILEIEKCYFKIWFILINIKLKKQVMHMLMENLGISRPKKYLL